MNETERKSPAMNETERKSPAMNEMERKSPAMNETERKSLAMNETEQRVLGTEMERRGPKYERGTQGCLFRERRNGESSPNKVLLRLKLDQRNLTRIEE